MPHGGTACASNLLGVARKPLDVASTSAHYVAVAGHREPEFGASHPVFGVGGPACASKLLSVASNPQEVVSTNGHCVAVAGQREPEFEASHLVFGVMPHGGTACASSLLEHDPSIAESEGLDSSSKQAAEDPVLESDYVSLHEAAPSPAEVPDAFSLSNYQQQQQRQRQQQPLAGPDLCERLREKQERRAREVECLLPGLEEGMAKRPGLKGASTARALDMLGQRGAAWVAELAASEERIRLRRQKAEAAAATERAAAGLSPLPATQADVSCLAGGLKPFLSPDASKTPVPPHQSMQESSQARVLAGPSIASSAESSARPASSAILTPGLPSAAVCFQSSNLRVSATHSMHSPAREEGSPEVACLQDRFDMEEAIARGAARFSSSRAETWAQLSPDFCTQVPPQIPAQQPGRAVSLDLAPDPPAAPTEDALGQSLEQATGSIGNDFMQLGVPPVYVTALKAIERYGWSAIHGSTNEWTALHWAASEGHLALCARLLAASADPRQPDHSGRTSVDYAQKCGHLEILQMLQRDQGSSG
ncbi:unnamed protein product [Polarella glacialis]|uniref:Uncharacterized protein n=1 Tax=Polarella glacialis TaxID=89957 RepID=A0A813J078_POLGL|nr:unnamed protein product [Polarella glacialis]